MKNIFNNKKKLVMITTILICLLSLSFYNVMAKPPTHSEKNDDDWDYSSNIPNMFAIPEGNVGVGVENPNEKFEVSGMIYSSAGGFKFPDGTIQTTAVNGIMGDGHSLDSSDGSSTDVVYVDDSGFVGIGTQNPRQKLHVSGGRIILDNSQEIQFLCTAGSKRTVLRYNDANILEIVNGQNDINMNCGGKIVMEDILHLTPISSFPSSATDGDICVKTTSDINHIYCYLNGEWKQLD